MNMTSLYPSDIKIETAITDKLFETNFSFRLKYRTKGKVQFLLLRCLLLVLTNFCFRQKHRTPCYNSMKF